MLSPHQDEGLARLEPGRDEPQVLHHLLRHDERLVRLVAHAPLPQLVAQQAQRVAAVVGVHQPAALARHPAYTPRDARRHTQHVCDSAGAQRCVVHVGEKAFTGSQVWGSRRHDPSAPAEVVEEVAADLGRHVGPEAPGQRHDEVALGAGALLQLRQRRVQRAHLRRKREKLAGAEHEEAMRRCVRCDAAPDCTREACLGGVDGRGVRQHPVEDLVEVVLEPVGELSCGTSERAAGTSLSTERAVALTPPRPSTQTRSLVSLSPV